MQGTACSAAPQNYSCCQTLPPCFGGLSRVSAFVRDKSAARAFAVSAGNWLGDTINWQLFQGDDVAHVLRTLSVRFSAFGSADLFGGPNVFASFVEKANLTILAANVRIRDTTNEALTTRIKSYEIVSFPGGVRIGFTGVTTTRLCEIATCNNALVVDPVVGALAPVIATLRGAGVDYVVLLSSSDFTSDEPFARIFDGPDVIFSIAAAGAAQFSRVISPSGRSVTVAAPASFGAGVGVLSLSFDATRALTSTSYDHVAINASLPFDNITLPYLRTKEVPPPPLALTPQDQQRQRVNEVVGRTVVDLAVDNVRRVETTLGDFVTDAVLDYSRCPPRPSSR